MSLNQYLKAVVGVFETRYPQFWWDSYFLDWEMPEVQKHLKQELDAMTPPSIALQNLLTSMGRM